MGTVVVPIQPVYVSLCLLIEAFNPFIFKVIIDIYVPIAWGRKWQLIPVFLPGESHGQRSLAGHGP